MTLPALCACGCGGLPRSKGARFLRGHHTSRVKPQPLAPRFFASYVVENETGCWNWILSLNKQGYGAIQHRRADGSRMTLLAHRASYLLHFGEIPSGMLVCHKCDNPRCVNPNHLFIGTYQDNSDDKMAKGRDRKVKGEANPISKLTNQSVASIRNSNLSLRKLAKIYGVTYGHVGKIRRGELWR